MNDAIIYALIKKYHRKGNGSDGEDGKNPKRVIIEQKTPSAVWHLEHNMDCYPSVTIVDDGDNLVFGDTSYINSNVVEVTFCAPFSGRAFLN